jgi:hypothetical protein
LTRYSRALRLPAVQAAAAGYVLALLAGLLSLWVSGAFNAGFSGADEPAHFLNGWFVSFYERQALGHNPMAFAAEFYLHYPKISIGHWPPAYYGLLSPFFLILPATPQAAFALNLFVCALPAIGIALLLARLAGRWVAVGGALLWAMTPLALEGDAFFMLDQPLAACTLAATLFWIAFAARQNWPRILCFAALCALAVLIKGNGWLLLFVPAWHIALTARWRLLASPKLWAGAILAAAAVIPWYLATAGIAADGFNYQAGPTYAWQAFAFNLRTLYENVGPVGLALAVFGTVAEHRARHAGPGRWNIAAGCLSLVLATLTLQSLVPVDITDRYMAPALPALIVLAALGAVHLARLLAGRVPAPGVAAAAALAILAPGLWHLAAREPKADLRLVEVAARADPGRVWLIDGGSGAEGAFIAAMAVRDPGLKGYTVRGSSLLGDSDFMGKRYHARFASPAAALAELRRLGIGGLVLVTREGVPALESSAQLAAAVRDPASGYRLAASLPHRNRPGLTEVYLAVGNPAVNVPAIRALGIPGKAKGLE